jgi:hypothetical protein
MAAPNVKRPGTKWDKHKNFFVLTIPNSDPASQAQLIPSFDKDFENLFADESQEDEWDHVEQTAPTGSGATATIIAGETAVPIQIQVHSQPPPSTHIPTVDRLPPVDALSRPTTLFPSTAPYILMMTLGQQGNEQYIRVDCSHEPSLQLLATYLQKWQKTSANDSMKVCIISSNQPPSLTDRCSFSDPYSLFNSKNLTGAWDTYSDSLVVTPTLRYYKLMNPTLVLAFIEGVLGYKLVHTTGNTWMYRSTTVVK